MITQIMTGEGFKVECHLEESTIAFQGSLRLGGTQDYAPIADMLNNLVDRSPDLITLDLCELGFLNSSGISMLSKFAIAARNAKTVRVVVMGSKNIPWQSKTLRNLEKLLPGLRIELL